MVITLPPFVDHLRTVLGETRFDERVASGAALDAAEAVQYARSPWTSVAWVERVYAFLFTDIEQSTRGWQGDAASMRALLARHDSVLGEVIVSKGGRPFKHTGDGCCVVFDEATAAVTAAVESQLELTQSGLRVRMGLHVGPAEAARDDFFGLTLNRCARIMNAAQGGQVLASLAAREVALDRLGPGIAFIDLGEHRTRSGSPGAALPGCR